MPRVYISDKLEDAGLEILKASGVEIDNRPGLKGDELKAAIRAAEGVVVRSGTRITAELLEDPGKLKAIVRGGVGVDNIDVAAATRKGIVVMNTPDANTLSTAEHTISLLMSMARHIPAADASMRAGKWEKSKFLGAQLTGKTLGEITAGLDSCARRAADARRGDLFRPPGHIADFLGRCQSGTVTGLPRTTDSAPAGVSRVITDPAPTVPPAPRVTGAASTQLLPTCASSSITVRCLLAPS